MQFDWEEISNVHDGSFMRLQFGKCDGSASMAASLVLGTVFWLSVILCTRPSVVRE